MVWEAIAIVVVIDDFDGDGVPNGEEIRVGSSPINQLDTPNGAVLPTALQIVVFERLDDGRMRLVIGTEPGQSYLLEQSTDLSQFETVETMTANSATLEFVIPPSDLSKRFYRITGQ